MKTSHKLIIAGAGYLMVGLGRGLYVSAKYPAESTDRGFAWWARAALAWPYDLAISGLD